MSAFEEITDVELAQKRAAAWAKYQQALVDAGPGSKETQMIWNHYTRIDDEWKRRTRGQTSGRN